METQAVEAIYEHGGFRLVGPAHLQIAEGQTVRLVVEPIETPDEVISLAGRVYEGLTEDQIESIEQHIRRREAFFGERTRQ